MAVFAVLTLLGARLAWFHGGYSNKMRTNVGFAFIMIIGIALACLGPGAFSLDARRYGRREIVIPQRPKNHH
jgi:hypothetical protein